MTKSLILITLLTSACAFATISKTNKKNLPEVTISYGDTVMIDQFLEKKLKNSKDKSNTSIIALNLVCLKRQKGKSTYKCRAIDLNTVSK